MHLQEVRMDDRDRITIEPGKRGQAVYQGHAHHGLRRSGLSRGRHVDRADLDDFPDLEREDIQACLAYAADRERHQFSLAA